MESYFPNSRAAFGFAKMLAGLPKIKNIYISIVLNYSSVCQKFFTSKSKFYRRLRPSANGYLNNMTGGCQVKFVKSVELRLI